MYRSFSNALSLKKYEPATLGRETRQTITRQPREKVPVEERGAVTRLLTRHIFLDQPVATRQTD
jgi:hypothetical protein